MKQMIFCVLWLASVSLPTLAQDDDVLPAGDNAALRYWVAFSYLPQRGDERYETILDGDELDIEEARAFLGPENSVGEALDRLDWATQADTCVWAINYEDGPYALLPHLGPARTLARLCMMRARLRLHDGDIAGAAEDVLAVMKLGRAFDNDRLLISSLVGMSIEARAVNFTAEHLSAFDDAAVAQLVAGIAGLPERPALSEIIQGESDTFIGWLERTLRQAQADGVVAGDLDSLAAGLGLADADPAPGQMDYDQWLAWVDEAKDAYTEAGRVADLPYDAYLEAIGELEAGFESSENKVISLFIPSVGAVRSSHDKAHARRAMLQAMLAIRLDDDADLADHPAMQDPFGEGTFTLILECDETGQLVYGLRSALPDRDGGQVELHTDAPLGVAQP
ncbi:hypothetical protein OT109_03485 [Phycisphaeraceae bacterium D3-23]